MKWTITLYFLAAALAAQAQTLSTVATIPGYSGVLIQGADGNFYGTTSAAIFKMTPAGVTTTLYTFPSGYANSLIQGTDGNFYGTSTAGTGGCVSTLGLGNNNPCGAIFKMTPQGALTTLYNFHGADGYDPFRLILGADGNFYGLTLYGGATYKASQTNPAGLGTVFKLTPAGTLSTLHSFTGVTDGSSPSALIEASDGNFYGTANTGGSGGCPGGCGTIFEIAPAGSLTTLYSFNASGGLGFPTVLFQTPDGDLCGLADLVSAGGAVLPYSGVFRITPAGALTSIASFTTNAVTDLIPGTNGNLYGTTENDQVPYPLTGSTGTIFEITSAGQVITLYTFCEESGCASPGTLIQASNGNLYVTALSGNSSEVQILEFSFASPNSPAIAPSGGVLNGASFQPGISPGSWITINGTNLSSTTDTWAKAIVKGALPTTLDGVSVMVGDQAAYIEYVSPTQINAVVPDVAPNLAAGSVPVTVTTSIGSSPPVTAQLSAEQPAFFQWGTYAVATRQNFSLAVKNGTFPGTTTVPAAPGEVIILWGTGFGPTSPSALAGEETPSTSTYNTANTVSVTVGGKPATVYGAALAPGYAGLFQIAIQIPASLANGDYPVVATINGVPSPSTTLITVQK
jgi:uncharacterized protein (TIGR03437 family)